MTAKTKLGERSFQRNLGNYTVAAAEDRNNRISWVVDWRFLINGLFLTIGIEIIDDTSDKASRKVSVRQRPT